ncbi:dihydrodipicolinate reductase [Campylobacter hyointestinalis]|uniref:4-hydroxy-tetrahydrodipicolinate reductase n=1 Tax=Campylobacter hyointestinalis TaxID=198 RepID=UPI0004D58189|nr:4-hydroxy-tetrahydrodipicolinate reductase [Campylobacter hyointestinalis]ANE32001.1 4-hydroxy-tetrahydrodipicolinate reductase [Campylobacter hyointestinalis subsp. hyointestinalis LMG 9260]KEA44487.1 dihydrodipicolinate reductase [Campylobacter hyointestinalis subsp. hyointestinalis]QKF55165.1 4-hydroxy-tetrahydrodipicolinate reductase [Campylobacter hyointestinalis subsp. hyointestinalis]TXK46239.1 4-hydroxy-tetrahydrodipicolinate reductase [Campylobacter hyointestinalis]SFT51245.1 dihyd
MIKIGIHGASGKMGTEIISNLKNSDLAKVSVAYSIDPVLCDTGDALVTDDLKVLFDNSDVIIDFTIKEGALNLINYARTYPKPLVIGTTGLGSEGEELLGLASSLMPILQATNMSLGVAVLNRLVGLASKALSEFDIEIVEMHHRHKKDAPSGTALTLATHAAKARNLNLSSVRVSSRDGMVGARSKDEIAVMALRGGDVVGRHTVGFYNDGEFIELNHTATSRATFAKGAIKAAIWLEGKQAGLYSIYDCLGI